MRMAAGPRAAMAAQELGEFINPASWRLKQVMRIVPAAPKPRKMYCAVW